MLTYQIIKIQLKNIFLNRKQINFFSSNYLNFNPTHIKTKNGYLLEKSKLEKTYTFERNDVLISLNT